MQSKGEEIANSVSHGVGLVLAAVGMPYLILSASRTGETAPIIGAAVFAVAMTLLYLASTVYHAMPADRARAKRICRVLDHAAIYLMIAGTYTPFTLGVLRGAWGWTLLSVIWGLALCGVVAKVVGGVKYDTLSTCVYIAMGWLILIAVKPLTANLESWGLFWLVAGGLSYTGGVAFYALQRVRYSHLVWHLFVLAGTCCHFVAVLNYAA